MRGRVSIGVFLLLALLVLAVLLSLSMGSVAIPFAETIKVLFGGEATNASWETIILRSRMPATLAAVLAGAALSLSGLQMQTLFRNPVAGPFVLGISSGASLGVALLILLGGGALYTSIMLQWGTAVAAGIGAFMVFSFMMLAAYRVRNITVLLIIGLMLASATAAVISILQSFSSQEALRAFIFWSFGSFRHISYSQLLVLGIAFVIGLVLSIRSIKPLNLMLLGEDYAASLGQNVKRERLLVMVTTSVLAGVTTAFCGPVAFVGLAVPHLCRALFRTADHRILVPAVILAGGALTTLCNMLAAFPGVDYSLPLNAVTSILGAPVVIWVVLSRKYSMN